ncbi:MAG: YdcF family protein [Lachnospiraceae bacterium]|nr:YdcF family protein [Lachnospiraceae bacterium]
MKKKAIQGIRIILIIIVAIIGGWCMAPLVVGRIINIGNVTGIIVGTLLGCYGLFMPQINRGIVCLWTKRSGKAVLSVVVFFAAAAVILVVIESICMVAACHNVPASDATVVVLGCKARGERPSVMLRCRLDAAYEYLNAHPDAVCVLSGGQGPDETISEADCMYVYLTGKGIETERLYKEEASTSTVENLRNSLEVIRAEGLDEHIAIVTDGFHEYRAHLVADSLGIEHGAVPVHTAGWLFMTYYIRELYGIMYEWVV